MRKLTKEEFIKKAKNIHGDKYDYSKVEYLNSRTKICIICPEHGEFWQTPNSHLDGQGCPSCGERKRAEKKTLTKDEFIKKAIKRHGNKYDYSKVEYINSDTKVKIICPKHGEFLQAPGLHLYGHACPKCGLESSSESNRKGADKFIDEARDKYGDKYDYSKVEYKNAHAKVCIICPDHGEFWQSPNNHLRFVPKCCKKSKLENKIRKLLNSSNIDYEEQKTFDWLKYKKNLYLDFFLPKCNIAIECQGEQHFENFRFKGDTDERLLNRMKRDRKKKELCNEHGITILYFAENTKYNTCCGDEVFFDGQKIKEKILKNNEKSD